MSDGNRLRAGMAAQCSTEGIEAFAKTIRPSSGCFESARQKKLFGFHSLKFRGRAVFAVVVENLGITLCWVLMAHSLINKG